MKKVLSAVLAVPACVFSLVSAEKLNFHLHPLWVAGKASLTEDGYVIARNLDTVNFSPEVRLPVQLVYRAASEKTGMFGYAWSSPQLESSAQFDKDGVLWTTPWGEKFKFYPIQEGEKSYEYGWLDKVLAVRENGKKIASFDYQVDGQIAQTIHGGKAENFLWDDLALVHRGETSFINEPYVTGGNPILSSKQGVMFNDMLGNTLGTKQEKYSSVSMTAFGETKDNEALFTGKPYIGELGYAFLFRNYRADQGKWLTSDPLGYPDGWNNFAYCNNEATSTFDFLGNALKEVISTFNFK